MRKLRHVTEAEVVAEFLKNEFYEQEFHRDRQRFERLVMEADITNKRENAARLALLFRRRAVLWRELPADIQWWEARIEPEDIRRTRVLPRAQWLRLARGNYLVDDVVERLRRAQSAGRNDEFHSKIQSLNYRLRNEPDDSAVMLIGLDESHPFTIIEGNHRFTAAMLASPALLQKRFRFYCGFSPRMMECCWYHTSIPNLWRYAKKRARYLFYDPNEHLARILAGERPLAEVGEDYAVATSKAMPESK